MFFLARTTGKIHPQKRATGREKEAIIILCTRAARVTKNNGSPPPSSFVGAASDTACTCVIIYTPQRIARKLASLSLCWSQVASSGTRTTLHAHANSSSIILHTCTLRISWFFFCRPPPVPAPAGCCCSSRTAPGVVVRRRRNIDGLFGRAAAVAGMTIDD